MSDQERIASSKWSVATQHNDTNPHRCQRWSTCRDSSFLRYHSRRRNESDTGNCTTNSTNGRILGSFAPRVSTSSQFFIFFYGRDCVDDSCYFCSFSLIDQVAEAITVLVRDVDEELALRRTDYGRLLHIGLTDSRAFPQFRRNRDAYLYVDHYESLEEILSACILSSYIPGLTGPMAHKTFERNGAVRRANKVLISMTERGSIKNARGIPLRKIDNSWIGQDAIGHDLVDFQNNILFWDGGLVNVFPAINLDTCIVTPFTGFFTNPTISPSSSPNTPQSIEAHNDYSRPALCLENLRTIRYIAFSSESLALESWFEQGYNDANAFLNHKRVASDFLATKLQSIAAEAMVKGMTEVSPRPTEGIL